MKIHHRVVDKERGIVQVTTTDERTYIKNGDFANPYRSVTWILGYYPKGEFFYRWVAQQGLDAVDLIKNEAANRGYKIHKAVELYMMDHDIPCDLAIEPDIGLPPEELTADEYQTVIYFHNWYQTVKAKAEVSLVKAEETIFNDTYMYAGTADLRLKIGDDTWTIDLKTGNERDEHALQVTAYGACPGRENDRLGLLYVGPKVHNQQHWKFVEVAPDMETFLAVLRIFEKENPEIKLNQYTLPLSVNSTMAAIAKPKTKKG